MTDFSECLTAPISSTCSNLNYGAILDPSNWWILLGAFAGALVIVAYKSLNDDQPHSIFTEPIIYTAISIIMILFLIRVGISAFFLNYLVSKPSGLLSFISLMMWGGMIAFFGDEIGNGGGKTGIAQARQKLSSNQDVASMRTAATETIPGIVNDLWIPILMILFIFITYIIRQFRQ